MLNNWRRLTCLYAKICHHNTNECNLFHVRHNIYIVFKNHELALPNEPLVFFLLFFCFFSCEAFCPAEQIYFGKTSTEILHGDIWDSFCPFLLFVWGYWEGNIYEADQSKRFTNHRLLNTKK